ncbi:hypothetical protein AB0758_33945 [Tolypothrix bouteillei VB521301_2]
MKKRKINRVLFLKDSFMTIQARGLPAKLATILESLFPELQI